MMDLKQFEGMTPEQIKAAGYKISFQFSSYARGYLSRKDKRCAAQQELAIAGGIRRGLMYNTTPCYNTTSYHLRNYYRIEEDR